MLSEPLVKCLEPALFLKASRRRLLSVHGKMSLLFTCYPSKCFTGVFMVIAASFKFLSKTHVRFVNYGSM